MTITLTTVGAIFAAAAAKPCWRSATRSLQSAAAGAVAPSKAQTETAVWKRARNGCPTMGRKGRIRAASDGAHRRPRVPLVQRQPQRGHVFEAAPEHLP